MDSIKFTYLYRDAGNYKKWVEVVFSNPDGMPVEYIENALRRSFLQDGLFIAHQVRLCDAFFFTEGEATSDDHCFHEFDAVGLCPGPPNDGHSRSIGQFIEEVEEGARGGWIAFNPHDVEISPVREGWEM